MHVHLGAERARARLRLRDVLARAPATGRGIEDEFEPDWGSL